MSNQTNSITITKTGTGYELRDGDKTTVLDKFYPGEPTTLVLPANSANRKYCSTNTVANAGGTLTLQYKASKTFGPRTTPAAPKATLESFLTGDDQATFKALKEKAIAAKTAAANTPMSDLEKAKRAAERANARVAELETLAKAESTKDEDEAEMQDELKARIAASKKGGKK